jgi:hypothetical protein
VRTIEHALDKVLSLRGVTFNWKNDANASLGVIAQELEKVFPELVLTDGRGFKSVAYGNLAGALIEAVKELNQKNDKAVAVLTAEQQKLIVENQRLAKENAALLARLDRLENTVDKLAEAAPKHATRLAAK